jgi:DHA2 family multidrug resistance protein
MSRRRAWLAISAGTLGGFMALLDISVVNSALPIIQGEIGATQSEATWIGTAYLTTEIIIIPLVSWLERMLGLRRFLFLAAISFTLFSVVCGMATSLTMIVLGRLGQGLSGGMMLPTAFALVPRLLPPEEHSRGIAIISVPILVAPIVGPLVGGWLTEHFSWHYAFFINVPICAILVTLLFLALEKTPGDLRELANADWFGVCGMIIGLGSLTLLLEEGHRQQWFESRLIWQLAIGGVLGAMLITVGQLRPGRPVLNLALLRDRAVAAAMAIILLSGLLMFGILFLVPQFLIVISGYNSIQAAQVLFIGGVASVCIMVLFETFMRHSNLRLLVAVCMAILAAACLITSNASSTSAGGHFVILQIALGSAFSLASMTLQQMVFGIAGEGAVLEMSSLVSTFRNLGGSIGLAALASFQEQRLEFHHWRLSEMVSANDPQTWDAVTAWSSTLGGGADGDAAALRMIDAGIMRESLVMMFNDAFFALTVISAVCVPLCLLLRAKLPAIGKAMVH